MPVVDSAREGAHRHLPPLSAHFYNGVVSRRLAGSKHVAGGFAVRVMRGVDRGGTGGFEAMKFFYWLVSRLGRKAASLFSTARWSKIATPARRAVYRYSNASCNPSGEV